MGKIGKVMVEVIILGECDVESFLFFVDCWIRVDCSVIVSLFKGNWCEE